MGWLCLSLDLKATLRKMWFEQKLALGSKHITSQSFPTPLQSATHSLQEFYEKFWTLKKETVEIWAKTLRSIQSWGYPAFSQMCLWEKASHLGRILLSRSQTSFIPLSSIYFRSLQVGVIFTWNQWEIRLVWKDGLKVKSTKPVNSFKGFWFWWGLQLISRLSMITT